jgi:hypothetical protein
MHQQRKDPYVPRGLFLRRAVAGPCREYPRLKLARTRRRKTRTYTWTRCAVTDVEDHHRHQPSDSLRRQHFDQNRQVPGRPAIQQLPLSPSPIERLIIITFQFPYFIIFFFRNNTSLFIFKVYFDSILFYMVLQK